MRRLARLLVVSLVVCVSVCAVSGGAEDVRRNAVAQKVSEFAKTEWSSAETALSCGRNKYNSGDYAGARTELDKAGTLYAQAESAARKAKQEKWIWTLEGLKRGQIEPEMVLIKGGAFMMGSNDGLSDERPVHRVTVSDFHIGKYEVTNAQYKAFREASGYDARGGDYLRHFRGVRSNRPIIEEYRGGMRFVYPQPPPDACPIEWVGWKDAVAYCKWLSDQTGKRYRLPTEAEWEYACRAGTTTEYSFGDGENSLEMEEYGWWAVNSGRNTHEVGSKKPNPWGLHDMHGNVWEWCADWYGEDYYSKTPETDPGGPSSGKYRVLRGGSWSRLTSFLRSAYRSYDRPLSPGRGDDGFGFRVARDP